MIVGAVAVLAGVVAGLAPVASGATSAPGSAASLSIKGSLRGVAATSARNAWAVGSTDNGRTLIVHWDGRAWKPVPSPSLAGSHLAGVAATSARNAWAVGFTDSGRTLIVHWDGKAWKRVPSPEGSLSGVAAVSASDVWAVGGKLILHWTGNGWKRVPSPKLQGSEFLNAVAATSRRNAWAVGEVANASFRTASLILRWNGSAWKRVPTPTPSEGRFGDALEGVAATSAASAWAVGCTDGCPSGGTPLIERWRAGAWKQVAAPTVPFALYNLTDVAATGARAWAVGGSGPVTSEGTATVSWNGRRWTLSHGSAGGGLTGVTAISAKDAWAVGGTASGHILIRHWNGSTWK